MSDYIGKICPYCKTEIKEDDEVKVCPACGIPHHQACWEENKGCTTFGCSEQHYEEQHTNPTDVCVKCGTPLGDGQLFCPKCGTPKGGVKANVCGKCGAELQDGQEFCPKCGQKVGLAVDTNLQSAISQFNSGVEKKKKKSKTLPIVLVIVLIIVGIGGYFTYSTIQNRKAEEQLETDIQEYKDNASAFYIAVLASGGKMETIGNTIQTYWGKYVSGTKSYGGHYMSSVDSAVSAAISEESSNITSVKTTDSTIQSLYKSLLTVPDTNDQQLIGLRDAVKDVYKAYQKMYDCVIDVSGNYTSFKSEFGTTDSDLADAIGELNNWLD